MCVLVNLASKKNNKQLLMAARPKIQVTKIVKKPKSPNSPISGVIKKIGENAKPVNTNIKGLKTEATFELSFKNSYGKFRSGENSFFLRLEFSKSITKRIRKESAKPEREKTQIKFEEIILKF